MYKTIECNYMATNKNINRIKVVLVEKKKTNKWLADQIGKDQATVSKWCTNTTQSTLETLVEIAKILEVDIRELLVPTDKTQNYDDYLVITNLIEYDQQIYNRKIT